jgi:hypothetical protein
VTSEPPGSCCKPSRATCVRSGPWRLRRSVRWPSRPWASHRPRHAAALGLPREPRRPGSAPRLGPLARAAGGRPRCRGPGASRGGPGPRPFARRPRGDGGRSLGPGPRGHRAHERARPHDGAREPRVAVRVGVPGDGGRAGAPGCRRGGVARLACPAHPAGRGRIALRPRCGADGRRRRKALLLGLDSGPCAPGPRRRGGVAGRSRAALATIIDRIRS